MFFLIVLCVAFLWFFIETLKYFIFSASLREQYSWIKTYSNKLVYLLVSFIINLFKSLLLCIAFSIIYPIFSETVFLAGISFFILILFIKIIPEIVLVLFSLKIPKKYFVFEIMFNIVEYFSICILITYLTL